MLTVILWIVTVAAIGGIAGGAWMVGKNYEQKGIQMQEDAIRKLKYGY